MCVYVLYMYTCMHEREREREREGERERGDQIQETKACKNIVIL